MLAMTDHEGGRWHVIAGDQKKFARVSVIETVITEMERAMVAHGMELPEPGAL
jgi:polyphosphate kinase 2 (PPK2 family)